MNISDYEDLSKVTLADLKVAIYSVEEEMDRCLKNKNIKGYLSAFKLKLNKLSNKKSTLVEKENYRMEKQR
jgi:hypothetical protein